MLDIALPTLDGSGPITSSRSRTSIEDTTAESVDGTAGPLATAELLPCQEPIWFPFTSALSDSKSEQIVLIGTP
jgi:hypothetical protein